MKKSKRVILGAVTGFVQLLVSSQNVLADLSTASDRIASELGTRDALEGTAECDLDRVTGQAGGNLGLINQMMCIIKLESISITGDTGVTKEIDIGSGQILTAHIVLNSPGPTVDGVDYTYELKVWTCGSNCDDASNFLPAVYTAFNANSSKTINNGVLINNFGADSGQLKGTSFVKWDTGSDTATRTIDMVMVDCSSSPTGMNYAKYRRTGDAATLNEINSSSSGAVNRAALAWDTSTGVGNWQDDNTVNAGGDTPTAEGGFTRSESGDDYAYSAASTGSAAMASYPDAISGTVLSGATYQGIDCTSIYTTGVPTITNGTGILTTPMDANGGMTTHPENI